MASRKNKFKFKVSVAAMAIQNAICLTSSEPQGRRPGVTKPLTSKSFVEHGLFLAEPPPPTPYPSSPRLLFLCPGGVIFE